MKKDVSARRWPVIAAFVAILVVALVGTAIAESGTATISASKLAKKVNRALAKATRAVRIARNTSKQKGPQGPQGAPGPQGNAGPQGSPGVSGLEIVEAATASNSANTKEEGVECPAGKRVFGGGVAIEGAFTSVAIDLSQPISDNTWLAAAHEHTETASNWELLVYAICGNAS